MSAQLLRDKLGLDQPRPAGRVDLHLPEAICADDARLHELLVGLVLSYTLGIGVDVVELVAHVPVDPLLG